MILYWKKKQILLFSSNTALRDWLCLLMFNVQLAMKVAKKLDAMKLWHASGSWDVRLFWWISSDIWAGWPDSTFNTSWMLLYWLVVSPDFLGYFFLIWACCLSCSQAVVGFITSLLTHFLYFVSRVFFPTRQNWNILTGYLSSGDR